MRGPQSRNTCVGVADASNAGFGATIVAGSHLLADAPAPTSAAATVDHKDVSQSRPGPLVAWQQPCDDVAANHPNADPLKPITH